MLRAGHQGGRLALAPLLRMNLARLNAMASAPSCSQVFSTSILSCEVAMPLDEWPQAVESAAHICQNKRRARE